MPETSAYQIQAMKSELKERQEFLQLLKGKLNDLFTGSAFKCVVLDAEQAKKPIKLADEVYIPE